MVRPVPIRSAASPLVAKLAHSSLGVLAPRIADEAAPGSGEHAQRLPAPGCRSRAPEHAPQPLLRRRAQPASRRPRAMRPSRSPSSSAHVAAANRFVENFAKIAREKSALRKSFGDRPPSPSKRLAKWSGSSGPGAHPFGPDVEQVRRLGRRIGNALADATAAIDQNGADTATRKLRRKDRPRSAAADNCDRNDPIRFHSQASSPG